jgi:hypothetical protein
MKKLIALTLLLCVVPLSAHGDKADDLHLEITITRGERSKDSNSQTTLININGGRLVYKKTYGGRLRGRAPETRELKLKAEDQRNLVRLIKGRNLLRTESIEREQTESGIYFYFDLSIEAAVNQSKGVIQINGSRKASDLKQEKLYKDVVALIEELYAIINRTDKRIVYEPLIN